MRMITSGMSRTVFIIGNYAIKFPSMKNGQSFFVTGMLGNILEKEKWDRSKHPSLMQVYFCFPFGLFTINRAYKKILGRRLTEKELGIFPILNIDNTANNIAIEDNNLVLLDYGNCDAYLVLELNCTEDTNATNTR